MLMIRCGRLALYAAAAFYMFFSVFPVSAESGGTYEILQTAEDIISWKKSRLDSEKDFLNGAGTDAWDWYIIGASRLGLQEDYGAYLSAMEQNVAQRYKKTEKLDKNKTTEWDRIILSVLSCGGDPMDFSGVNLVNDGIFSRTEQNSIGRQGLNGWIWALICMDAMYYKAPVNTEFNRERIVDEILDRQNNDGGFSLSGKTSDIDITSMALQSLAPYCNDGTDKNIKQACLKALSYLSEQQLDNGGFGSCESTSQAIIALCSLGIDYESDERFLKQKNVFDALMEFKNSDGGFAHKKGGDSDSISSAQALCALAAAARKENGLRRIYDFMPEFSDAERNENAQLQAFISGSDSRFSAESAEEKINSFDIARKTYLYSFGDFSDKSDFCNELGVNDGGNGYIFNIESMAEFIYRPEFTAEDFKAFQSLKQEITSSDKPLIAGLTEKLKANDYVQDREIMLDELKNMSEECERIIGEISDINKQIVEELYPFDSIDDCQKEMVKQLYERSLNLSETDRGKITGFEELEKAYKSFNSAGRSDIIRIAAAAVGAVSAVLLILIWKKRIRAHKQKSFTEEE